MGASSDPHASGSPLEGDPNRRDFIHIAAGVAAVGLVGGLAWPFIDQMNPAGDTLALASIEFDLSKVVEGQQVVVKRISRPSRRSGLARNSDQPAWRFISATAP